jgi:dTDP-4-dehydrorhamnose 3,5-epimerase-like enzyme
MSPNHWDGQPVGNKHYFFMIDGCQNNGTARGFFNEFLKEELNQHRKVLEMVGSKMKISGDEQLSGLGFSSTAKNTLVCRVKGSFTRTLKIVF